MTKYRVLELIAEGTTGEAYRILESGIDANSGETAMRKAAKSRLSAADLEAGVTLVAVPLNNWTEEPVRMRPREPVLSVGGEQVTIEEALSESEIDPPGPNETTPEPEEATA